MQSHQVLTSPFPIGASKAICTVPERTVRKVKSGCLMLPQAVAVEPALHGLNHLARSSHHGVNDASDVMGSSDVVDVVDFVGSATPWSGMISTCPGANLRSIFWTRAPGRPCHPNPKLAVHGTNCSRMIAPDLPTGTPLRCTICTLWWSSLSWSKCNTSAVPVVEPSFSCKRFSSKTCNMGGHNCERVQSSCQALRRGALSGDATTRWIPLLNIASLPALPAHNTP